MAALLSRPKRFISVLAVAGMGTLGLAPAVLAAAPANDTYAGRITVSDGYSATIDTTEATTDANDDAINAGCGFVHTDASVWYTLAGTDETYVIDVSNASYPAGAIIATGDPVTGFTLVSCDLGRVSVDAAAGTTYTILVFDSQLDFEGNGGSLTVSVETFLPPTLDAFSVNPVAHLAADGSATVTGTATCRAKPLAYTYMELTPNQRDGKSTVSGFVGATDPFGCDGAEQTWSITVHPDSGAFRRGRLILTGIVQVCSFTKCDGIQFAQPVRLRN
jgi:hypothetical protein